MRPSARHFRRAYSQYCPAAEIGQVAICSPLTLSRYRAISRQCRRRRSSCAGLKAISDDPRLKLFGVSFPELDSVEPLFTPDDYKIYDRFSDGDPYDDDEYIRRFRIILSAIKSARTGEISLTTTGEGSVCASSLCRPGSRYSEKDGQVPRHRVGLQVLLLQSREN